MRLQRSLLATLAAAGFLAACGDDDDGGGFVYTDDGQLTVMTRNLYLGAELTPLLTATTPEEFAAAAAAVFEAVTVTNDFRKRAGAIADEIVATRPDLVGLQEASLWRIQNPSAGPIGFPDATVVALDYLSILLGELASRGVPYVVAEEISLFDLEAPVPISTTATMDVRLTDRQVVLAISGLPTSNPRSAEFSTLLEVSVVGTTNPVAIPRGWTAVDTTIGGQRIAFYNTHPEAFSPLVNAAQAAELAGILDAEPLSSVVLVGDLNSQPGDLGYLAFIGAGFTDLWGALSIEDGFTCCFDADLTVTATALSQRIDDVLWGGALVPVSVDVVGEDLADRTGSPPLWPSDHAGVVGVFDPSP